MILKGILVCSWMHRTLNRIAGYNFFVDTNTSSCSRGLREHLQKNRATCYLGIGDEALIFIPK